ncbi:sigma-70 family RNA polymerase sigma factor [uncultured Croceitalea sp.]|uniref:RNA polymerase sigma factor n=1 Tax=uncultured Croceitalea sp. TaxID=1798908 RepID=UPI0033067DC4
MSKDFYKSYIYPHLGIIIKICRAYTNTQEDFEDYFQEVCLQIWRSKANFNEQSAWSTWVYRLTLNVCLTFTRKKKRNVTVIDNIEHNEIDDDYESAFTSESFRMLNEAIKKLSKLDRAIILLYLEEKSYKEIAEIIGLSSGNIGTRINRIKNRLKKILNGKIY